MSWNLSRRNLLPFLFAAWLYFPWPLLTFSEASQLFSFTKSWAARASKQDMTWKTAQDTHDFNFFGSEMGHQKKLSPGLGQVEGKTIPHRALEKRPQFVLRKHWRLDYPGFYIFTTGFVIFCLNNVCQCCWVQIQRLPDELVIKWPVGLFRNWGARKLHKFLIISQWNRLQFLAQNHSWTTASYGWLYNFTVHLLYNI